MPVLNVENWFSCHILDVFHPFQMEIHMVVE